MQTCAVHCRQTHYCLKVSRSSLLICHFFAFSHMYIMSGKKVPIYLLGEGASPHIGNTLWRVSTMFTRPAITSAGSVRIRMKFGALRVYCLELALTDFRREPRRSESGRSSRNFVFFCEVNNARLCRFPVSQISRNLHTRRGSMSP